MSYVERLQQRRVPQRTMHNNRRALYPENPCVDMEMGKIEEEGKLRSFSSEQKYFYMYGLYCKSFMYRLYVLMKSLQMTNGMLQVKPL